MKLMEVDANNAEQFQKKDAQAIEYAINQKAPALTAVPLLPLRSDHSLRALDFAHRKRCTGPVQLQSWE